MKIIIFTVAVILNFIAITMMQSEKLSLLSLIIIVFLTNMAGSLLSNITLFTVNIGRKNK